MKIVPSITTYAGNGIAVDPGDGGPAISAGIVNPARAAVDSAGNVYIAEYSGGHRVHKVAAGTGIITTVAGNGVAGFSGDGGAATSAQLNNPDGVIFDSAGNLYISEISNNRIRKVDAGTGIITTYVGNGTAGYSGGPATSAALNAPVSVTFDSAQYPTCFCQSCLRNNIEQGPDD
jgi:sugar lactone lactonase YvrE